MYSLSVSVKFLVLTIFGAQKMKAFHLWATAFLHTCERDRETERACMHACIFITVKSYPCNRPWRPIGL
jgi:hypothetical protein